MISSKKRLAAVVAMSENRVIGRNNTLPWHLPADLRHFKAITSGHTLIMGRKTFESIGKPLPNRNNIVVSRDLGLNAKGCIVVNSLEEALASAEVFNTNIYVIGGAQIYAQTLPILQKMYLTLVHHQFDGDAFFPEYNEQEWRVVSKEAHEADAENAYAYTFYEMERV